MLMASCTEMILSRVLHLARRIAGAPLVSGAGDDYRPAANSGWVFIGPPGRRAKGASER